MHSSDLASAPVQPSAPSPRGAIAFIAFGLVTVTTLAVGISLAHAETAGASPRGGGGSTVTATGASSGASSGRAAGELPEGTTAFDERLPGIGELQPELLEAVQFATTDAQQAGIALQVNSGWRSAALQQRLQQEAVDEHGSETEAARWVATADTSAHVTGEAVDIGDADAAAWLASNGAAYGLCQIYENEAWHFEFLPEAVETGCPAMYADPTEDPRMR